MFNYMPRVLVGLLCFGAAPLNAATQAQIDQAVQRGVQHLKSTQAADGSWNYTGHMEGATALAGLALLESGEKPSDPVIQRAAQFIRSRGGECTQTYSISLMIFFLDRLGDRRDQPAIAILGERLRNGQMAGGGWTYFCPTSSPAGGPAVGALPALGGLFNGDNSNTQFAILALWVARRYNVNVKEALERTDRYFRNSQDQDGGWGYVSMNTGRGSPAQAGGALQGQGTSTGAMTCAGLLGLLVQFGNQASLRASTVKDLKPQNKAAQAGVDPLKDPAVQAGLKCLEQFIDPQGNSVRRLGLATELYFLWSVERVGVAYGLKKIGRLDWYELGVERILSLQQADGSWSDYAPNVGTSLALLFLKRANVASDLTRLVGGDTELRSGRDVEELKNAAGQSNTTAPSSKPTARLGDVSSMSPDKLKEALPGLSAKQQTTVLEELRDRKGTQATLALAGAIGLLKEPQDAQARKFLVQRLQRMTPTTLVRYLEYDNQEIRLAAAKAATGKEDRALVGPLIELLSERNAETSDAAHEALVMLTGQQFGPFAGKSTAERFVVIKRWKTWWDAQNK